MDPKVEPIVQDQKKELNNDEKKIIIGVHGHLCTGFLNSWSMRNPYEKAFLNVTLVSVKDLTEIDGVHGILLFREFSASKDAPNEEEKVIAKLMEERTVPFSIVYTASAMGNKKIPKADLIVEANAKPAKFMKGLVLGLLEKIRCKGTNLLEVDRDSPLVAQITNAEELLQYVVNNVSSFHESHLLSSLSTAHLTFFLMSIVFRLVKEMHRNKKFSETTSAVELFTLLVTKRVFSTPFGSSLSLFTAMLSGFHGAVSTEYVKLIVPAAKEALEKNRRLSRLLRDSLFELGNIHRSLGIDAIEFQHEQAVKFSLCDDNRELVHHPENKDKHIFASWKELEDVMTQHQAAMAMTKFVVIVNDASEVHQYAVFAAFSPKWKRIIGSIKQHDHFFLEIRIHTWDAPDELAKIHSFDDVAEAFQLFHSGSQPGLTFSFVQKDETFESAFESSSE